MSGKHVIWIKVPKPYLKHNHDARSVLASHISFVSHKFKFDDIMILITEKNRKKREFLEMLNIEYHPNTLNIMQDTMHVSKKIIQKFNK